jgi:hypothetical protein
VLFTYCLVIVTDWLVYATVALRREAAEGLRIIERPHMLLTEFSLFVTAPSFGHTHVNRCAYAVRIGGEGKNAGHYPDGPESYWEYT